MEKPKFTFLDKDSNPRGKTITRDEIKQCISNLVSWFKNHTPSISTKAVPISSVELSELTKKLIFLPESLEEVLKNVNGGLHLQESYKTLSGKEILEAMEENVIYGFWNNNYIPVAKDAEANFLIVEIIPSDKKEKYVVTWNRDCGVIEQVNENFGLYIEEFSNGVINKEFEYVEGVGFVENA